MILIALAAGTGRVADTGPLTTTALIAIAIFAAVVVLGIIWGARQKRIRAASEREEAARSAELTAHPPTAPAPPPLADAAVTSAATPPAPKSAQLKATETAPKTAVRAKPAAKPKAAAKPAAAPKTAVPKPTAKPATAPAKAVAKRAATPKAAAPKPATKPAPKTARPKPAAAPPAATAPGYGLIDVKGLGPKAVPLLTALGVGDLAALAALGPARATEIDGQLGAFSGRLGRDRWVAQAKLLAAGKVDEFEATYGKL